MHAPGCKEEELIESDEKAIIQGRKFRSPRMISQSVKSFGGQVLLSIQR